MTTDSIPIFKQVRRNLDTWRTLVDSDFAVSIISSGIKLRFKCPKSIISKFRRNIRQRLMDQGRKLLLRPVIEKLVNLIFSLVVLTLTMRYQVFRVLCFLKMKPSDEVRIILI